MTMGEPTAAPMPLPAPTQRTRSEHHFPALPIGRFRCCDLTVPVWQAFANGSYRPVRSPASGGFGNIQSRLSGESDTCPFKIVHARVSEFGRLRSRRLGFLPSARRRVTIGYRLSVPEGFHRKNGLHVHKRSMDIVPHQTQ